jgi:hypothetical protein
MEIESDIQNKIVNLSQEIVEVQSKISDMTWKSAKNSIADVFVMNKSPEYQHLVDYLANIQQKHRILEAAIGEF